MRVIKVLNNNSVIAADKEAQESILIGKGLAFGKKPGDEIDVTKAEKKYNLESAEESGRMIQLIKEIPHETITAASKIVEYGREYLNRPIKNSIEIAIIDHINYALERIKKGMLFENFALWEIKRFYAAEYEAAVKAIDRINEEMHLGLPKEEASFIALHFINDTIDGDMNDVMASTNLIQDIISFVQLYFKVELDVDSLSYHRFINHLKFFARRVVSGDMHEEKEYYLYDFMRIKYQSIFDCVLKIEAMVRKEYNVSITQEEMSYLMVHIERVLSK